MPTTLPPLALQARARGVLLGLACGDTLGAQVEFLARDTFPPVTDVVGGGPHALRPGDWTDDPSMAACLAESLVACRVMAVLLVHALQGASKDTLLAAPRAAFGDELAALHPDVRVTAEGAYLGWERDAMHSGGYAADSLAAAAWCFARTESFEACVLAAANLGHDADTTAAIAGALAGAFYGEKAIPQDWRFLMWGHDWLTWHAEALCARGAEAWTVPGKPCPPPPNPARSGEQTQHRVDGMILGGQALVDAVTEAWVRGLAQAPDRDEGPLWVDPDLPVWGTINRDEVWLRGQPPRRGLAQAPGSPPQRPASQPRSAASSSSPKMAEARASRPSSGKAASAAPTSADTPPTLAATRRRANCRAPSCRPRASPSTRPSAMPSAMPCAFPSRSQWLLSSNSGSSIAGSSFRIRALNSARCASSSGT
ncbi:MAG: ADP-ribosylglycohydrolase family protein [Candidatus Sericytochromatia bacterium]|nr:ADP-ribosylglycohydrolase family protein [Candidatus Sericytochromatia bacterium]